MNWQDRTLNLLLEIDYDEYEERQRDKGDEAEAKFHGRTRRSKSQRLAGRVKKALTSKKKSKAAKSARDADIRSAGKEYKSDRLRGRKAKAEAEASGEAHKENQRQRDAAWRADAGARRREKKRKEIEATNTRRSAEGGGHYRQRDVTSHGYPGGESGGGSTDYARDLASKDRERLRKKKGYETQRPF